MIRVITDSEPDLVLLDVQMPGLTGFEVARRLLDGNLDAHIVFVTAFDRCALEAFEVNAVDYLLKPVEPRRLEQAIEKVRRRVPPTGDRAKADRARGAGAFAAARRRSQGPAGAARGKGWRAVPADSGGRRSSTRRLRTTRSWS